MKLVFMGTPAFSVPTLQRLVNLGHTVQAVFTQPDRPSGRGHKLQPPPVKRRALELGLPVYQPASLKRGEDAVQTMALLRELQPDLIVVIAYGQLLPQEILDLPVYGCINLHASLLPRWRGAAPIQRAILAGDTVTGVTAMQMAIGMDTGDMLLKRETAIAATETANTLHDRLSEMSADVMQETLQQLEQHMLNPVPQNDADATLAAKITKEMSCLDFTRPAQSIDCTIRAVTGYAMLNGKRVKFYASEWVQQQSDAAPGTIVDAATMTFVCGDGFCVRPLVVQAEGSRAMAVSDFLRGAVIQNGDRLRCAIG